MKPMKSGGGWAAIGYTLRMANRVVYGIHRPGTAYRMDEVPIPLRAFLSSDYPSDGEVLKRIEEGIGRME